VPRSRKDLPFRARFYDLAEIHDRHAMSHVLDDGEVVTYEQQRDAQFVLQIPE
jgi:hypothetical protein